MQLKRKAPLKGLFSFRTIELLSKCVILTSVGKNSLTSDTTNKVDLFMSDVIDFNFENQPITVVTEDGEVWFIASELSKALGYSQTGAMNKIIDNEDKKKRVIQNGLNYVNQSLINESGVYQAIFGSTKPEAKRFKKWVTGTVLPAIRKTGGYIAGEEHAETEEELIYRAMEVMSRKIEAMKPKAEYHDKWMIAEGSFTTTEVAKKLGISARKLNEFLREEGIKWKKKDLPIAGYEEWFSIVDRSYKNLDGDDQIASQCKVSPTGVKKIVDLWEKKNAA